MPSTDLGSILDDAERQLATDESIPTQERDAILTRAIEAAPVELDLKDRQQDEAARRLADVMSQLYGPSGLDDVEGELIRREDVPLFAHLAVKLARSRAALGNIEREHFVSVVFAVYQEHTRILTPEEHPYGEDFLNRKVEQLRWLFHTRPAWELVIVDDGCPDGSGRLAEEIISRQGYQKVARVLYLQEAIERGLSVTEPLESAEDSRKGGSISYGMWEAVQELRRGHVVVYTDADLSTHLGQIGLLVEAISAGADCAAGSRREKTSVVVKGGARDERGKLFIYLWKRLLPQLEGIVDTQCGCKAFRADLVEGLVAGTIEKRFAFDIELLLRTELHRPGSITNVPIAWIDSESASTTTDLQPYLAMLKSVAAMYRRYLPQNLETDLFAEMIEQMDEDGWNRLLENIPSEITERDPVTFDAYGGVSAEDVEAASR